MEFRILIYEAAPNGSRAGHQRYILSRWTATIDGSGNIKRELSSLVISSRRLHIGVAILVASLSAAIYHAHTAHCLSASLYRICTAPWHCRPTAIRVHTEHIIIFSLSLSLSSEKWTRAVCTIPLFFGYSRAHTHTIFARLWEREKSHWASHREPSRWAVSPRQNRARTTSRCILEYSLCSGHTAPECVRGEHHTIHQPPQAASCLFGGSPLFYARLLKKQHITLESHSNRIAAHTAQELFWSAFFFVRLYVCVCVLLSAEPNVSTTTTTFRYITRSLSRSSWRVHVRLLLGSELYWWRLLAGTHQHACGLPVWPSDLKDRTKRSERTDLQNQLTRFDRASRYHEIPRWYLETRRIFLLWKFSL